MPLEGRILVTGGAGYLARGIYRRAQRERWNATFTCLSRDDAKHAALQKSFPEIDCVLGDVAGTHPDQLAWLMRGYDLVVHCAASKYVDRAEAAAFDTTRTNVEGSRAVAEAAIYARVPKVLAISTDKACQPINTYGLTKAVMERLFQEADALSDATDFHVVRYGNVIGSTGSVIPMFMSWAAEGRPIRLTDPLMTRFWMSIDEAVDTIILAIERGTPGHISIPRMRGMQMKDLVRMALGYDDTGPLPEHGVEIIGIRPGEKRHENIVHRQESVRASRGVDDWIEIGQPTTVSLPHDDFEITSAEPTGGWIGPADMRELVEDAATV